MKYKWYKNPIKYRKELKELEIKSKSYENIKEYLISCIKFEPLYKKYKSSNGTVIMQLHEETKITFNIDVDKLFELIGYKTNFGQGVINVKL